MLRFYKNIREKRIEDIHIRRVESKVSNLASPADIFLHYFTGEIILVMKIKKHYLNLKSHTYRSPPGRGLRGG